MRGTAAQNRLSRGCPDVADPLRLAGQGHQVVLAPVGSSQDRGPTRLPRPAAAYLQRHGVSRGQTKRGEGHTEPVEPPVPGSWGPVGGAVGVILGMHLDLALRAVIERPPPHALRCAHGHRGARPSRSGTPSPSDQPLRFNVGSESWDAPAGSTSMTPAPGRNPIISQPLTVHELPYDSPNYSDGKEESVCTLSLTFRGLNAQQMQGPGLRRRSVESVLLNCAGACGRSSALARSLASQRTLRIRSTGMR